MYTSIGRVALALESLELAAWSLPQDALDVVDGAARLVARLAM
jgi:hypothetical protein